MVYGHFPIERYCLPGPAKNPDHFYAAYFRDPEGNKLAVVCRAPA